MSHKWWVINYESFQIHHHHNDFQKYHMVPQKMLFKFSVMYSFIHSPFSVSCLCMFSLPSRLQIKYQTWVRGSKMSMQQKFTCRNSAYAYGMHLQSHMPHMISVSCLCPCRVKLNGHFWKWADKIKPMIEKPGVIFGNPQFFGGIGQLGAFAGTFLGLFGKLDKKGLNTWF